MRSMLIPIIWLAATGPSVFAASPKLEPYLHSGELARGEQVFDAAVAENPHDDQARFSLGVLQLLRGVERLGQALYEYGCRSENNNAPFLRVPVPTNPDPSPISYADLRRMLDGFRSDLATAEATLAAITTDDVSLELGLAGIRFDLTGKNQSRQPLIDILKRLIGPNFRLRGDNPDFLVRFDRGDVAWLRAYCHLLMAMVDFQLAFDLERGFHLTADELFAKPLHKFEGTQEEKWQRQREDLVLLFRVRDPARLGHFRRHMLKVCELNRETWKYIRAEQDDDHEWLPNPRQKGVIELPVTDEMIDTWLRMVAEVEGLLDGKKIIPASMVQFVHPAAKKGLSLKALLDDPPDTFDLDRIRESGIAPKYQANRGEDVNLIAFVRVMGAFQNSMAVAYAVWFN